MLKTWKKITAICVSVTVVAMVTTVNVIEDKAWASSVPILNYFVSDEAIQKKAEEEAERKRLESLDIYSLDNIVDVRVPKQSNGNKMNVIMMIPDGQSLSAQTLARWYQGYRLGTDEYVKGLVRTYSAESAITDSAASATAYATGYKTNEGYEGVLPAISDMPGAVPVTEFNREMPMATVLEAAKLAGKSTGMVVTAPIMHATPAAFSSHVNDRSAYAKIAKQQIHQDIDILFGGGSYYLREGRTDGRDLINDALSLGYTFVNDETTLLNAQANKILGVFGYQDMNYDFDRVAGEPSLETMTRKAIEVLNRNENGFFLLVEGSKVDYAAHAHDPVGVISESLSFDRAFRAAVEFAEADGNTIVVSCADHANGGITIGVGQEGYASTNINSYLEPLKSALRTGAGVYQLLNDDRSNLEYVVSSYYGITDLTEEEKKKLRSTDEVMAALGAMKSKRANIGWVANGHTGEEVPLCVCAPAGYELMGVVDNTEISHFIQSALGVKVEDAYSNLFVIARDAFSAMGASIKMENISDSRAVIVVEKDGVTMKLPVDTSIAVINDTVYRVDGLTVVSGGRTYVSQNTVDLFFNMLNTVSQQPQQNDMLVIEAE